MTRKRFRVFREDKLVSFYLEHARSSRQEEGQAREREMKEVEELKEQRKKGGEKKQESVEEGHSPSKSN